MKKISVTLLIAGYICISFGFIGGIGYAVYLAGPGGLPFGMALWSGFVLWIELFASGIVVVVVGLLIGSRINT